MKKIDYKIWIIVLFAFILRIYKLYSGYGFSGNDASFFALYALGLSDIDNIALWTGGLINFHWGFMTPFIIWLNTILMSALGITITEFIITLPITVIGSLNVWMLYKVASQITDKNTGLLSALIYAVIPLSVTQSRTIAGTWIVGQFMLLLSLYLFIRYVKLGKSPYPASLSFSIYMVSSALFPFAIPLFVYVGMVYEKGNAKERLYSAVKKIPNFSVFPVLMSIPLIFSYFIFSYIGSPQLGYIGHMLGKESGVGFYLPSVINEFLRAGGWVLLFAYIVAILFQWKFIADFNEKSISLVWSIIFFFPFIFLIGPETTVVSSYLGYAFCAVSILIAELIMNTEIKFEKYRISQNVKFLALIIILLMTLSMSLSIAHRIHVLGEYPFRRGGVHDNTGIKTAGYFIRENLQGMKIFTDIEPYNAMYYTHEFIDIPTNIEDRSKIQYITDDVDVAIVENDQVFRPYLKEYSKHTEIYSENKKVLTIFTKEKNENVVRLDTDNFDIEFDQKYGNTKSLSMGSVEKLKKGADFDSVYESMRQHWLVRMFDIE